MSVAVPDAGAMTGLAGSVFALQHRLLELRGQIDAILALLGGQSALPSVAHVVATQSLPVEASPKACGEAFPLTAAQEAPAVDTHMQAAMPATLEDDLAGGDTGDGSKEITPEPDPAEVCFSTADAEEIIADAVLPDAPQMQSDTMHTEAVALAAETCQPDADADKAHAGLDTSALPAAEPQEEAAMAPVEPAADTAQPDPAPAPAMPAPAAMAEAPGPTPAASGPTASTDATAVPEAARVIAFQTRHRKEETVAGGQVAPAATPIRWGSRNIAARIAASIIALAAAATALSVADRTLAGKTQSRPWLSPLPAYMPSGPSWPNLDQIRRAMHDAFAGARSGQEGLPRQNATVASRYREVWPAGQ
jgi:hypothetical protein